MTWFYEIRSSNDAVLKRDGGFPTQDAAKIAGNADAKKIKNSRQPDRLDEGIDASTLSASSRQNRGNGYAKVSANYR